MRYGKLLKIISEVRTLVHNGGTHHFSLNHAQVNLVRSHARSIGEHYAELSKIENYEYRKLSIKREFVD